MKHFAIIQALCRGALANPSNAMKKQVERLIEALIDEGDIKDAESLKAMLRSAERNREIAPSKLIPSRAVPLAETLTLNTPLPVDKETASPLAEIILPSQINETPPVFNESLKTAVESVIADWRAAEKLSLAGIDPARSCLIYGAPGTGKTRLALWIARSLGVPVVLARLDGLMSSFLGTTSRNIGNLFAFANRYQCILLLDEFDAIAKLRDDPQEVGEIKRVVNTLLQCLDSRKHAGFTLGLTNHPNLLDPAIWRRFDIQLEISKPDFATRVEIARYFLKAQPMSESHLKFLAWITEGSTGAEIEMLTRAYRKWPMVNPDGPSDLVSIFKQFAMLNSARVQETRKAALFGDQASLFKAMKSDSDLQFSLAEIGELAGKDKSTVSRQIGK